MLLKYVEKYVVTNAVKYVVTNAVNSGELPAGLVGAIYTSFINAPILGHWVFFR
jgi:hypothetical protein